MQNYIVIKMEIEFIFINHIKTEAERKSGYGMG